MITARAVSAAAILAFFALSLGLGSAPVLGQQPQTGFPSLDTNDGKFVALAGSGLSTVAQPVSFWIGLPADQGSFTLDIFDGDQGGFWDVHDTASTVKVNFVLFADPLKNGQGTTVVASKTSADFGDDAWDTLYNGPVHSAARPPGGNHFYRLSVSFSDAAASANELNGFKVRVNGQVGIIPGTFGFVGAPINVDVLTGKADPGLGTARNQNNGDWHWYVYAPTAGSAVTITDNDADSRTSLTRPGTPPDNCTPGATCFAISPDIRYEVLAGGSQALNVPSPSGDLETVSRSVTPSQAGFLDWHWTGVDGHNLVFISSSHEIFASSAQVPLAVEAPPPAGTPTPAAGTITIDTAPSQSSIKGRVYADSNCNGVAEAGEGGLKGVMVTIESGGGWTARTTSGPDGQYEFAGLSKGQFNLSPAIPAWLDRGNPATRESVAVDGRVQTIVGGAHFGMATQGTCSSAAAPVENASAPQVPAHIWYIAEGTTTAGRETRLAITNPGLAPATAAVTFFPEVGTPVSGTYELLPASTLEILANEVLPEASFGARVGADQPITVERTMLFSDAGVHSGTGSSRLARSWQVPGIDTAAGTESWVLLLNPHDRPANLTLTFVKADGGSIEQGYEVSPQSRLTIFANSIMPEVTGSARVESDLPVMVEMSTYQDGARQGQTFLAVPSPARP